MGFRRRVTRARRGRPVRSSPTALTSRIGDGVPTTGTGSAEDAAGARLPGVGELFRTFLVIGASAFGMAVMQSIRSVPVKRRWLTQGEVDEGFGVVQLYPGAIMMDLAAFIGYRLRGIRGALAAAAGFLTPSLALMLGLSWAYFTYGAHPVVRDLVLGLDGLVVGVLASVAWEFGRQHARGRLRATVTAGSFLVSVAGLNVLWAVLGAFVVGAVALRGQPPAASSGAEPDRPWSWRKLALAATPAVVVAAAISVAAFATGALGAVTTDMAKIGTVAFGNGTVILPIVGQDAVAHHWLTLRQFSAGVAFGQVTPGPFLVTAAFVGYAAAGWWGGLAAGLAIFAPSVAMTIIVGEVYPSLRRLRWVRGAIAGIMAGFTGLLAGLVLILGADVLRTPAVALAAFAFAAARGLKWNSLAVFAAGLALWSVYLAAGGPV